MKQRIWLIVYILKMVRNTITTTIFFE